MSILNDILRNAVTAKASDIHINVGLPPLFRIHTVVTHSDFPIVTPEGAMRLCKEIMVNNETRCYYFKQHRPPSSTQERPGAAPYLDNTHGPRNEVAAAIRATSS